RYGIPTVRSICATSATEARAAAEIIGYPVAIKIISDQISHKSDIGGVQLNLRNGASLAEAYQDMINRISKIYSEIELNKVLVQPMITGGREIILGGKQDPQFGPVVLVGMGGIFVEIFNEVQVRVAPITRRDAFEMLRDLRSYPILEGSRGHQMSDIDSIVEALLRLSQLLCDFPEIKEIDINPMRVFPQNEGCGVLDARMLLN
ncbi:MAG: acetate--CoA ligase family protein, partial [Anaerolineales bacterium]